MKHSSRTFALLLCGSIAYGASACSSKNGDAAASPTGSEVAVSVVSGALNNNSGSGVAWNLPEKRSSAVNRALAFLNPVGTAYAATWSCTGDTLTPAFDGSAGDPYSFTPASCSVTWLGGRTASSKWSGPFTLDYGTSCDTTHAFMELQASGCEMTRTSNASGDTRTITGPDGNAYAIDHNTNGAGTGWTPTVSPAPNNNGVVITCGAGGCSSARTLVINGSHLTGTVTIDGASETIWDHTVSTGTGGISVTGAGADRLVSGSVTVQHNLIKAVSTTTFNAVGYTEPLCCFPTTGSVTTTFSEGSNVGKTESIAFTNVCGEATLTTANGTTESLTFAHCL